jgi:putative heme-binding domain-containing protein
MEFDPQGRLIIAKESQGLLRMTLSGDGDQVSRVEQIDDTLQECRGLVIVDGDLFANANNNKGLYRLRRIDDDRFQKPQLLFQSTGGVGHGRNDLTLGPDGQIYSIHGDAVDIPRDVIDYTSPFRDARRGNKTSEGHLLRIDPNRATVEVLAAGLRNPFGIDFNEHGDLFTYDADAEHDMGSPWYRPTRVSHLVPGGDYGWRGVTRSWPSYYPDHADNARPSLDIGKGSPTAVKFASGDHFPPRFRQACFILDWAYGRIIAVHCLPRGSSYLLSAETFLQGRPLNVTDLGFAPDGSMYLVTGGRKTLSALYRVRFGGKTGDNVTASTTQQEARRSFAEQSRQRRRGLESLLQRAGRATKGEDRRLPAGELNDVWRELGNADPWITQAAAHVIEQYPVAMWKDKTLQEQDPARALRGLLSLARSGNPQLFPMIVGRLNQIPLEQLPVSLKLTAIQAYSLCLTSEFVKKHPVLVKQTAECFNAIYPDAAYLVNQGLSDLLVRVAAPDVVAKTIALLKSSDAQNEQMHYLYVLRGQRDGWTQDAREAYFTALARSDRYVAGAGMPEFLAKIREEATATLGQSERTALAALIESDQTPPRSPELKPRKFVRKWTVKEILAEPETGQRDLERGRQMFAAAACASCHRVAGHGTLIGPDLTAANRRFSRQDLLTSIIEPSQVIAENYRSVQIVTSDGNSYVGQAVLSGDYRSPKLRLATDPARPWKTVEVDKVQIEIQRTSPISWMPTGLLDTLTRDEILDLLAYIDSAGQASR